jgi:hypothetical protein
VFTKFLHFTLNIESARDAVEAVVRSKLVYEKNSPDRHDVVLTLSRLAKHGLPTSLASYTATDRISLAQMFSRVA